MKSKTWSRRAEFVNAILVLAASYRDIAWEDIELDGVAGLQFNTAINPSVCDNQEQCNHYINTAIKFGAPVEGLVADGEFGDKWAQVIAICKQEVSAPVEEHEPTWPERSKGALVAAEAEHHLPPDSD